MARLTEAIASGAGSVSSVVERLKSEQDKLDDLLRAQAVSHAVSESLDDLDPEAIAHEIRAAVLGEVIADGREALRDLGAKVTVHQLLQEVTVEGHPGGAIVKHLNLPGLSGAQHTPTAG